MADARVKQEGTNQSAPGVNGIFSLRDSDRGGDQGDAVDNSAGQNSVIGITFNRQRDLQGTGTTLRYPAGRSSAQEF